MKYFYSIIFSMISWWLIGQNKIQFEGFTNCQLPSGWNVKPLNGNYVFNIVKNNETIQPDGSCMVQYKQTDRLNTSRRKFQLITNPIPVSGSDRYVLLFRLKFIRPNTGSILTISTNNGSATVINQTIFTEYKDLTPITIKLTNASKVTAYTVTFDYDCATNDFGTEIAIDDVFLSIDNDACANPIRLNLDEDCTKGHISTTNAQQANLINCTNDFQGAIWYQYDADFSGILQVNVNSQYNDGLFIYTGPCNALTNVTCSDKDEYGFQGEHEELNVEAGKTYYFRFAKKINHYGFENGFHCISLKKINQFTAKPVHDLCDNRTVLTVNGTCASTSNKNALMENNLPSLNLKSKADVWYSFTAISTKPHEITTNTDFAEVISVYKGTCGSLQEIQSEDLGNKTVIKDPIPGKEYFVQVSGYFATIEGNICLTVKEQVNTIPTNDECPLSSALTLNTICQEIDFFNNNISSKKPSCVVYSAPDVWYKFVAPAEKTVALKIQAGFIYNYGLYSGSCNSLEEVTCGKSPDPCEGFIKIENLVPGKTYYLQILSAVNPLKSGEGKLCVRIDEFSKTAPFQKLNLDLHTDCLHGVLGQVSYSTSGGQGNIKYTGPKSTELFYPGTQVDAFVEDENGCRDFASLVVGCMSPSNCKNSTLDIEFTTECLKDAIGRQTGEVIVSIKGKGGSGAYYLYGTPDGSKLKDKDSYKIILIDSDSCYVIEEGQINCPAFNCSQSTLKLDVSYDCIDTLLKAALKLDVSGNLGTYTFSGNNAGDLLDQGQAYSVKVTDEAGCDQLKTGTITCHFDSCAYSRPEMDISIKCIKDANGNDAGKGILIVNGSSKAGGIHYIGNQPGDTLDHLQSYNIELQDAFGCGVQKNGIVLCVPLSNQDEKSFESITINPNPTSSKFYINLNMNVDENITTTIYSMEGKYILSKKHKLNVGQNTLIYDLNKNIAGVYLIKLEGKTINKLIRIVKI